MFKMNPILVLQVNITCNMKFPYQFQFKTNMNLSWSKLDFWTRTCWPFFNIFIRDLFQIFIIRFVLIVMERRTPCAPGARGRTAPFQGDNCTHRYRGSTSWRKICGANKLSFKMMDVEWGFKALRDQLCRLNAIWASEHVSSRLKTLVLGKNEMFVILISKSMAAIPWFLENLYIVYQRWSFLHAKNDHPDLKFVLKLETDFVIVKSY